MTIATSVIVYPSRLMRMAMMTMAVLLLISAAQLLMIAEHSDRLVLCRLLSLVCVAAAIRFFFPPRALSNTCAIDISGVGEIRLHHTGRVAADPSNLFPKWQHRGEVVQLLKDSTLWSSMLLLRLQSANGHVFVVPVLPDSMDAVSFRSLSIACRWIAIQSTNHDN